ncbi:MAG: fluoride exporter [Actinomycetota bacterium]|jgi:CrcB protein|nr:fluoride exporter [Actinomycetota bacterium]
MAAIAAGGAIGAPARYVVAELVHATPGSFPWATFLTNVSGCLAIGFLAVVLTDRVGHPLVRPFLVTGFLGAFTTFSTFAVDVDVLGKDGHVALAATYVVASIVFGLGGVVGGMRAGRAMA